MFFSYFDEAGDDGLHKKGASDLFALSSIYFHTQDWDANLEGLKGVRQKLKDDFGLKLREELHIAHFLENKKKYHYLKLSKEKKLELLKVYCEGLSKLNFVAINVVINKPIIRMSNYNVLETAFTYSLNRINEHILRIDRALEIENKLAVIVDPGRVGNMRKISRKVRAINPTPARKDRSKYYDNALKRIIEDPLVADSKHSYFIQVSDLLASLVYQYMKVKLNIRKVSGSFGTYDDVCEMLTLLNPILNVSATRSNKYGYGIVCYPQE